MQLYGAGFFAPQNGDVALACLDVMDFTHKNDVVAKVEKNATLYNENIQLKQQMIQLAAVIDQLKGTDMAQNLQMAFSGQAQPGGGGQVQDVDLSGDEEHPFSARAKEQAQAATQVNE